MILNPLVRGPLVEDCHGQIVASFPSSAYTECRSQVVCLLPSDGPDGAIHARLPVWPAFSVGDRVGLIGGRVWQPPKWPACSKSHALGRLRDFGFVEMGDPFDWLGRGSGLTPSGDDRICGWLIASHALGLAIAVPGLLAAARERTHKISFAHIQAAAKGWGCAPFHRVVCDLLDPKIPQVDLAPLKQIGHTSGQDAWQGVLAALTEFVRR